MQGFFNRFTGPQYIRRLVDSRQLLQSFSCNIPAFAALDSIEKALDEAGHVHDEIPLFFQEGALITNREFPGIKYLDCAGKPVYAFKILFLEPPGLGKLLGCDLRLIIPYPRNSIFRILPGRRYKSADLVKCLLDGLVFFQDGSGCINCSQFLKPFPVVVNQPVKVDILSPDVLFLFPGISHKPPEFNAQS